MKKYLYIAFLILQYLFCNSQTQEAAEHYKQANEYAEKSKQNYIIAAILFAVVIIGNIIRKQMNKTDKKQNEK